jgi:hypothetical protein
LVFKVARLFSRPIYSDYHLDDRIRGVL